MSKDISEITLMKAGFHREFPYKWRSRFSTPVLRHSSLALRFRRFTTCSLISSKSSTMYWRAFSGG